MVLPSKLSDIPGAEPVVKTVAPVLQDFLQKESAGGIVLIFAAALALALANSPYAAGYFNLLDLPVFLGVGDFSIAKPLLLWINDGLMAVFFFLVGLEVKREVMGGELSSWDKASLPVVAAIGGMLLPALVYVAFNNSVPDNLAGWAIPAATDIAFALGILALLGKRVPVALKALLLGIAVIDDIGAIAIIALFYSGELNTVMVGNAMATLFLLFMVGRFKVESSIPYVLLTILLWVFVLKSGVHATLAGVAAAMCVPMTTHGEARPLERMEHSLHPWVAFLIIPTFGFANAGVSLAGIEPAALLDPLPLGVALGLLIGKQAGIFGFAWLAVKSGIASLPKEVNWRQLHALSLLAAIGFTMSLFIGGLAFADPAMVDAVKLGVLAGSTVAAVGGYFLLERTLPTQAGVPAT